MTPAPGGPSGVPSDRRRIGGANGERPPTLRDLPGIGAAVERSLRESGVTSVADLADANESELVGRLGDARGVTGDKIRLWIAAARRISSNVVAPDLEPIDHDGAETPQERRLAQSSEPPERHDSFVLTLSVDEHGNVQRSTIRHTRTGIEDTRQCWSPAHLAEFVADHAGLTANNMASPATRSPGFRPKGPGPVGAPLWVDLDAGHLMGGGHRSTRIAVEPPEIPSDVAQYDYELAVTAHQLGRRAWQPLGRVRGRVNNGERLVVDIAADDLPVAVHRVMLAGHIRGVDPPSGIGTPTESGATTA